MASLTLRGLRKKYESLEVIHGVDLDIDDGEFVVFVGPSGCGKSTLLRMIAGLEDISSGTAQIGDRIVNDIAASKRGVSMVFQTYALYPHMTVYQNMSFGLKQAKTDPKEIDIRVKEAAEILQITDYLDRSPKNLSGGQRQRIGIARALYNNPQVLVLDEATSALDNLTEKLVMDAINNLNKKITIILVAHRLNTVKKCDNIFLFEKGELINNGKFEDLKKSNDKFRNTVNN